MYKKPNKRLKTFHSNLNICVGTFIGLALEVLAFHIEKDQYEITANNKKNMKKINKSILVVALIALSISAKAQRVGLEIGYVNSIETTEDGSDAVNGFQVGPMAEKNLQGNLNLQYGILYTYLRDSYSPGYGLNDTYTGHFIDVPVRFKADFPVTNYFSFFAFGGPNFQLGLAQNTEESTEDEYGDIY